MADEIEMALEEMKQKLQALATKYKAVRQEKAGQLGSAAAKAPQPAPANTQPKTEPAPSNDNGQLKTEFDKISAQVKQFQQTKDRDERERMAFELGQLVENWEDLYKAADEPSKKAAAPLLGNVQNLKAQLGKFTVPKGNQPASNQTTNETKPADNKTNDSRLKAAFDETFKASYERIEQTNKALDAEKDKAKREKIAFELGKHIENWEDLYNAADEAIKPLAAQQQATIQTMKAKLKGENMPASTPPAQGESPQNKDNTTTNPAKENAAKPSANSLSGSVGVGGKNAETDVRRIQNLLNRHGIRPALQESGKIDDQTITNIKKFQEIKTGVVDGVVEPDQNTWKALLGQKVEKTQTTPAPQANTAPAQPNKDEENTSGTQDANALSGTVGRGGQNNKEDVLKVQKQLKRHGLKVGEDGIIGEETIAAIETFQQAKLGAADGLIDPSKNTWKALLGAVTPIQTPPSSTDTRPTSSGGKIAHPNPGASVTSKYGYRTHPISGKRKFHYGIDLSKGLGSPIYAAADGTVQLLNQGKVGYGKYIIVTHANGYSTLYGHLSAFSVANGAKVKKGDLIAKEGSTGGSTGSHLHFEVRMNGKPQDPAPYLSGSQLI